MSSSSSLLTTAMNVEMINEGAFYLRRGRHHDAIETLEECISPMMTTEGLASLASGVVATASVSAPSTSAAPPAQPQRHRRKQKRRRRQTRHEASSNKTIDAVHTNTRKRSSKRKSSKAKAAKATTVAAPLITQDIEECQNDARSQRPHVFSSPIRISDRFEQPSDSQLALVCVYNLALAHHSLATSKPQWRRALKLYKIAHLLQVDLEGALGTPALSVAHSMGLQNNIACVYHELGRPDKAEKCWQHLLLSIAFILDQQQQDLLDVGDWNGYLDNTWHLIVADGPDGSSEFACAA